MRLALLVALLLTASAGGAKTSGDLPGRWSPDGSSLTVFRCADGGCSLAGLVSRTGGRLRVLSGHTFAWSPDGRRTLREDGDRIYLADANGDDESLVATGNSGRWAPDGTRIAYLREHSLVVRELDSGAERVYPYVPGCKTERCALVVSDPEWSPDGKRISVDVVGPIEPIAQPPKNPSSHLSLLDTQKGAWRDLHSEPTCYDGGPTLWSPDSRWLAYTSGDCDGLSPKRVIVHEVSGARRRTLANGRYDWAPRGHTLAYASRGRVYVRDVDKLRAPRARVGTDFSWSPDGSRLAIVRDGVIWIGNRRVGRGTNPRWFAGGRWLAYAVRQCGAGAGIHVRDLDTNGDLRLTKPC